MCVTLRGVIQKNGRQQCLKTSLTGKTLEPSKICNLQYRFYLQHILKLFPFFNTNNSNNTEQPQVLKWGGAANVKMAIIHLNRLEHGAQQTNMTASNKSMMHNDKANSMTK